MELDDLGLDVRQRGHGRHLAPAHVPEDRVGRGKAWGDGRVDPHPGDDRQVLEVMDQAHDLLGPQGLGAERRQDIGLVVPRGCDEAIGPPGTLQLQELQIRGVPVQDQGFGQVLRQSSAPASGRDPG